MSAGNFMYRANAFETLVSLQGTIATFGIGVNEVEGRPAEVRAALLHLRHPIPSDFPSIRTLGALLNCSNRMSFVLPINLEHSSQRKHINRRPVVVAVVNVRIGYVIVAMGLR